MPLGIPTHILRMLREDDRTTVVLVEWITIRYDCWRFDWEGTGNLTGDLTGV